MDTAIKGDKAALRYFWHVGREERRMDNDLMIGGISGKRRRGRQRTRWLEKELHTIGMTESE